MRILRSKFHRPKSNTVFARVAEYHTSGIALASPPVVSATNVLMDRTTANVGVGDRLLEKQSDRIDSSFQYGAISTPTVEAVANSIAILEGGKGALLTPSGQSSLFLVISTISRRGGTLLVSDSLTYSTLNLLNELACRLGFRLRRLGVREVSKVTVDELVADSTFCVLLEAPGGFDYEIPDIKKVFEVAKQAQVKCVFDNTWSSSVFFCPIKFGADVVILSLSKCYGGTVGVALGAIVTCEKNMEIIFRKSSALLGLSVSPTCAERLATCLSTLRIRVVSQDSSTRRILAYIQYKCPHASFLHPSLSCHPSHKSWKEYFCGACSVFTICFFDVSIKELTAAMDRSVLFRSAYGWGGNSSSYYIFDPGTWRIASNNMLSSSSCVRIYVGLEDWRELAEDLNTVLLSIGSSEGVEL